jgi:threonine/homoserine/homoserine lactone efflux protein
MIGTLLTFFAVGILALVAISIILAVVGTVFSLAFSIVGFLLFKVAPILLLGWIVLKVIDRGRKPDELSAADRDWLESGR